MERLSTWVTKRKKVDVHIVNAEENRQQSGAEEIANSISHGIGLIAALVGTPILIVDAARNENGRFLVGAIAFCSTMIMLYLLFH